MIEAAVAHNQATGKTNLLDIVRRQLDLVIRLFGPNDGQKRGYCGHEEIELALVKLSRLTGEKRYSRSRRAISSTSAAASRTISTSRPARAGPIRPTTGTATYQYNQSRMCRCASRIAVVGHAVRAMYLYCAMADLGGGDRRCSRCWRHAGACGPTSTASGSMSTGGLGPSEHNEGFTTELRPAQRDGLRRDLRRRSGWCSGRIAWRWLEGDGRYADVMEQALYNNALSGLSLDGERFFYDNPLASRGTHHRWIWHRCPCCPPNIARLVASLGSYVYSVAPGELAVHLYAESNARLEVDGVAVGLRQTTNYPWEGTVEVAVDPATPRRVHPAPSSSRLVPLGHASLSTGRSSTPKAWQSAPMPACTGAGSSGDKDFSRLGDAGRAPVCASRRARRSGRGPR